MGATGLLKGSSIFFILYLALFSLHMGELQSVPDGKEKLKILVGSPIYQKPAILKEFLDSLKRQKEDIYTLDYYFIDDNESKESSLLLVDFAGDRRKNCLIEVSKKEEGRTKYISDDNTHHWRDELVWKVASFKDKMIQQARDRGYDYLFLIDSDIVMHPETIGQLIRAEKDIISNIFWTAWNPGAIEQPQVWLTDFYTQYEADPGEEIGEGEKWERTFAFYHKLRVPGTYEVGGLGACTLISRNALEKEISFKKIKNVTFWGEDRHFCIRAAALGLGLFVDTHYPSYHIYRESALKGVNSYLKSCRGGDCVEVQKPKITLSMVMKNEAGRYLRRVLQSAREYISDAVIIDDGSSDESCEVVLEELKGIPLKLVRNEVSKFANEYELRKQLWDETIKREPEWILALDADEIFEERFKEEVADLCSNREVDAYFFRLYDMWDEESYRDDSFWQAHKFYRPFLFRYKPEITYLWNESPQHCGRVPVNVYIFSQAKSELRLKHYGWAKEADRVEKFHRYQRLDPEAKYGWEGQYASILDPHPHLVAWEEG